MRPSMLLGALAAGALAIAGPGPALAGPMDSRDWENVPGDWCAAIDAQHVVANRAGSASGCVDFRSRSAAQVVFRAGAHDIGRARQGAYTGGLVEQRVDGRWRATRPPGGFIFAADGSRSAFVMYTNDGDGTSAKIERIRFRKAPGATRYRVRFESCAAVPDRFEDDEPGLRSCRGRVAGLVDW